MRTYERKNETSSSLSLVYQEEEYHIIMIFRACLKCFGVPDINSRPNNCQTTGDCLTCMGLLYPCCRTMLSIMIDLFLMILLLSYGEYVASNHPIK